MLLELTADLAKSNRLLERCQGKHPCPPAQKSFLPKDSFFLKGQSFQSLNYDTTIKR